MKQTYYITTPIYYPSDNLHIGHAYCTTIADTLARYHRLLGKDVRFLTGSDEHGQKIQRKAQEKGVTPLEYVTPIVRNFQILWEKLGISNDSFIRTSDERHHKVVQDIFQKIYDKGDIYKSAYEGLYCTPCETFWLERQLDNGNCPDCGRPVEKVQEESYFFKMSKYQDAWLQFIEENPDFIQPDSRRNEMINFVKQGLEDLCVSRTTFDWGIKVPFDHKHVVYVWFDALSNYISDLGYLDNTEQYKKFWPADLHLVGKEIVRFHTIIWPIMLMALGEPIPKQVYGHGWLVVDGGKMSKSKGNVLDPMLLLEKYGPDTIRYFLLREIMLGSDGNFSDEAFINRINADLSNDLGNLLHRTLGMIEKYHQGIISNGNVQEPLDLELIKMTEDTVTSYQQHMDAMEINQAMKAVWQLVSRTNKYIDETMPWSLAKDPEKNARLQTVLYNIMEVLRIVAILVSPYIPFTSPKMYEQIGLAPTTFSIADAVWGKLPSGTKTNKQQPLFPRFEMPVKEEVIEVIKPIAPMKEEITIDDFAKVDLRVVKVLSAEKVPKADKLLKLEVDLGFEKRTIVSGIAVHYTPQELVGKHVILVANLKKAKIRGVESHGMLFAASDDEGNLKVVEVPEMKVGSLVK